MTTCDRIRELLSTALDAALPQADRRVVDDHLAACPSCRSFASDLTDWWTDLARAGESLEPPTGLEHAIASSPCQRWLSLLFEAVDRQISEPNLERLFGHLERCAGCREAWIDLTLLHQTGELLEPSDDLVARCVAAPRRRRPRTRILERRTVAAAAYILAVTTSLAIGNPVLIARTPAPDAVQRVATDVGEEVAEVASDGRGEARVMLWRVWRAAARGADAVRDLVDPLLPDRTPHENDTNAASTDGGSDDD
jgi:predicted anti-sigma-YlaC factor YlaD